MVREELVRPRGVRGQFRRIWFRIVGFHGVVVRAVVAEAELRRKLIDGQRLDRVNAQRLEIRDLVEHVEEFAVELARPDGISADVELIDDQITEGGTAEAVGLPGKRRRVAEYVVGAGKRRRERQLPAPRIALIAHVAWPDDPKLILVPFLEPCGKSRSSGRPAPEKAAKPGQLSKR